VAELAQHNPPHPPGLELLDLAPGTVLPRFCLVAWPPFLPVGPDQGTLGPFPARKRALPGWPCVPVPDAADPSAGWALAVPALPQGPQGGPGARTGCAHRSGAAPHLTLSPWPPARHGRAGRFPDFPSRGAQLVPDAGGTHPRWPRGPCPHGWCLWGGTRRAQPDPWPLSGKAQGEWEEEPRAAADAVCRSAPCPSSCRRAPAAPGSALGWPMAPAAPRTPSPHCQGWSQHHPRGLWDRAGGGGGDSSHRRSVTSQTPGGSRPGWCFSNFYFKSHH